MGNVSSRPDEGSSLFIKDQARFSIANVAITNSRNRTLLHVSPNAFPASRYSAKRDIGDETPVDYIQDPESGAAGPPPSFLLRLNNEEELSFNFTFVLRQQQALTNGMAAPPIANVDTVLTGLTYVFSSNAKEVDTLVTREFHADPNLHKNPNVQLVGDYATGGSQSVQFSWTWKWRPPKQAEDRGGGWRNSCSFVEYDQRAHRLNTLASFNFWVHNSQRHYSNPQQRSPRLEMTVPTRLRVPSAQSIESRVSAVSDSDDGGQYFKEPQSPTFEAIPEYGLNLVPNTNASTIAPGNPVKVDVASCKPGEDPSQSEDGPLFRATMKSLEQKTSNMRLRMKKVLRTAEAAEASQRECNDAVAAFTEALREASSSNANAVRPALDHYFEKIAREILRYERQNSINLQKLIIDPISKLYNLEIKQADFKKRDFDEESKDYYAYVSKYLGQRSESLKEKKVKESDIKYQAKRRTFELKRFDYSSFMHDLHGGRKDQEVLSQLTKYADAQAKGYLNTAKKVEEMIPQLEALCAEVGAADKDFQLQRTERELKRREIEKNAKTGLEEGSTAVLVMPQVYGNGTNGDLTRSTSYAGNSVNAALSISPPSTGTLAVQQPTNGMLSTPGSAVTPMSASPANRFKGIRDLEDNSSATINGGAHRKEGLLWALSKPGSHVDPKGLNKTAWHKFWIVLDQGKLSEYVNWKDKLDLHMDPIDLRVASVREARNSDRRFCFDVITPNFTRTYQAPSEEDMKFWIAAINNALQSAFEANQQVPTSPSPSPQSGSGSTRKDIAAVLTGKSSSFSGHRQVSSSSANSAARAVNRHATTGDKPAYRRVDSGDAEPSALLQRIRNADEGNKLCADCGSDSKVDWCSINLGVLLCIECSGIHRSLGTHISKVRSLTLDTSAFTPDIVEIMLLIGNRVSNMVWEAKLDRFLKPAPHSTREQRLHFVTAKYSDRTYVQPGLQAADDLLLTSIKRNDIQNVLHALALRGNPNAHDRSRSTDAVFLALAAADPAAPGGSTSTFTHPHSSSSSFIQRMPSTPATPTQPSTPSRKPFAVAELLLQNGADIPSQPAPIPLSTAAKLYLEFKADQKLGRHQPAGARDSNGDTLSALPTISATNGTSPSDRESRLLKRGSSSGAKQSRPNFTTDAVDGFAKK